MPIVVNPFELGKVADLTESINIVPNRWGVVQRLGLFTNKMSSQKTILVPRTTEQDVILVDRNWDERNSTISGGQRDWLPLAIPHYPVDDAITPNDLDGNISLNAILEGTGQLETLERVRVEKMERIRRAHGLTLEFARMQVLKNGTVYAPSGTVVTNYYTEYGVTREEIPMNLSSTTVRPSIGIEDAITYLQDTIQSGDPIDNFVALCSPSFFSALVNNPFVQEQYMYFARPQGDAITVGRLAAGSPWDARFRSFDYGGVTWIEVRGSVAGVSYVEEGEAYMFPLGTSNFETYFAPANRFRSINKPAQESYYFEYLNEKDDIVELMTETNFLNVLKRPDLVITLLAGDGN